MFTKHLSGVPSGVSVKKEGENKTPQNKQKKKQKGGFSNTCRTFVELKNRIKCSKKIQTNICLPWVSCLQILELVMAQHFLIQSTIAHSKC